MASVQKRANGRWLVRGKEPKYDEATGAVLLDDRGHSMKRDVTYGTFSTKKAADDHCARVNGEKVTTGRTLDAAAGRETFGTFAAEWIEVKRNAARAGRIKERTAEDYADLLRLYALPTFAVRPIASISPRDAESSGPGW